MNIFKKRPKQEKDSKITHASADDKTTAAEQPKQNPHETGGCCGSCGGQKGQGL